MRPMQRSVAVSLAMLGLSALVSSAPSSAQTAGSASPPPATAAPAPAAASAPPAAGAAPAAPPAGSAEAKKGPPPQTGGYSWTDKPRAQTKKRVARIKRDPNAPLASYPAFRMAPDGTSKVWVSVTRTVDVQVRRATGHVTFVLTGVQVGVRNNTNPLVTTHFNTPLERARLLPDRAGALLVLDLRETAEPTHKVTKGPYGTMVLEVALPKAQRRYADRVVPPMEPRASRAPTAAAPGGSSSPRGPTP
jgi:hypothetical protein